MSLCSASRMRLNFSFPPADNGLSCQLLFIRLSVNAIGQRNAVFLLLSVRLSCPVSQLCLGGDVTPLAATMFLTVFTYFHNNKHLTSALFLVLWNTSLHSRFSCLTEHATSDFRVLVFVFKENFSIKLEVMKAAEDVK